MLPSHASANLAIVRCRGTGFTFGATADRFNFEAKLSERAWREFFLPPFFGAAEANVSGFMCSYSSITFTDHPVNTTACQRSSSR